MALNLARGRGSWGLPRWSCFQFGKATQDMGHAGRSASQVDPREPPATPRLNRIQSTVAFVQGELLGALLWISGECAPGYIRKT